jgi:hypothetical protein
MKTLATEIIEALREANRKTIKHYFEVGDRILRAVIRTDMSERAICREIVRLTRDEVSEATLRYCALMARKLLPVQRRSLIGIGANYRHCIALAHSQYDRNRSDLVNELKSGKRLLRSITCPSQERELERQQGIARGKPDHDIHKDPRTVVIYPDDPASIESGLARLIQVVGPKIADYIESAQRLINRAEGWNPRKVSI